MNDEYFTSSVSLMKSDNGKDLVPYISYDEGKVARLRNESREHIFYTYLHGVVGLGLFAGNDYDFSSSFTYAMLAGAAYCAAATLVNILVSCSFSSEANELEQKIYRNELPD